MEKAGANLEKARKRPKLILKSEIFSIWVRQTRENYCTIDLLFDWFGISCMTTAIFLFAKQTNPNQSNRRSTVQ
jgi:hypothetical protein